MGLITSVYLIATCATHGTLFVLELLLEYRLKVVDEFFIGWILLEMLLIVFD